MHCYHTDAALRAEGSNHLGPDSRRRDRGSLQISGSKSPLSPEAVETAVPPFGLRSRDCKLNNADDPPTVTLC